MSHEYGYLFCCYCGKISSFEIDGTEGNTFCSDRCKFSFDTDEEKRHNFERECEESVSGTH